MLVNCVDLDEKIDSESAYKAQNGKYYSSKDAYEKIQLEIKRKKWATNELIILLGFEEYKIIPTILFKVINSYNEIGYEALCETIVAEEKVIKYAMANNNFKNDYAKVKYVEAVINNNINDVIRKPKAEISETDDIVVDDTKLNNPKQKQKDISQFLEV